MFGYIEFKERMQTDEQKALFYFWRAMSLKALDE